MPNINSIPQVLYEPNQPYHYHYDNLPLRNILTRIGLVNIQVDTNSDMIRGLAGSAGTPGARIGTALNENGSLKTAAVNSSLHGIGHHGDGQGPDGIEYVRMKLDERAKLELVERAANNLVIQVDDQSLSLGESVTIDSGTIRLKNSSSILFEFEPPNIVRVHSALPSDTARRHNYSIAPVLNGNSSSSSSSSGPSQYKTTSLSTPYMEGTLRVYVNGVRIYGMASVNVKVPNHAYSSFLDTYIVSESAADGLFTLNRTLSIMDVIRIDFDSNFEQVQSSSSSSVPRASSSSSVPRASSSSSN